MRVANESTGVKVISIKVEFAYEAAAEFIPNSTAALFSLALKPKN